MSRKQGFTLVELLVAVAIVTILASIIFVVAAPMREASRQTTCMSNLRQIYGAWAIYSADWPGMTFPNTEMAYVPKLESLKQVLKEDRVLFCPDFNRSQRGNYGSSYILRFGDNIWLHQDVVGSDLFREELEKKGGTAAAVKCLDHDWNYYAPREKEIAFPFAKSFEIHLLFSGSIWKGRAGPRTTPIH